MGKDKSINQLVFGARKLRKQMTQPEQLLWKYLSNQGMVGVKFRRQHPVGRFIIDFYCPAKKLGIEIDGIIHKYRVKYDQEREKILRSRGISLLRFRNDEVLNSLDSVLKDIKRSISPLHEVERGAPTKSGRGEECL